MRSGSACLLVILLAANWARAAPPGELSLTLSAGVSQHARRSEFFVLAGLDVPLERMAQQVGRGAPLAQEAIAPAPAPAAPARRAPAYVPRLSPALARAVIGLALRAAGFGRGSDRIDSLGRRSKSSALLPDVQLRGARGFDHSRRYAPTTTDPYRYSEEGGMDWLLEARLSWRLSRLMFADEEIPVERLRAERAAAKQRLVLRVVEALLAWERARLLRSATEPDEPEHGPAELGLLEAEIWLDVLTGGGFSSLARRWPGP